jgi:hypothetical protein
LMIGPAQAAARSNRLALFTVLKLNCQFRCRVRNREINGSIPG